jgi:hypothetical protein
MSKRDEIAYAKRLLRSLDFIIKNPVLESDQEVRALKRIRNRLKRALKKITL